MNRALATRAIAAIALGWLAIPAPAQTGSLGSMIAQPYQRTSKTEIILGGAPSRLAAIVNQQSVPAPSAIPMAASYAVARSPASDLFQSAVQQAAMPRPVAKDRPDVFGSVALRVPATPLDNRWHQIMRSPIGSAAAAFVDTIADQGALAQIDAVNRYVNSNVRFNSDARMFGVDDRWSAAAETLRRGEGDCEDFAIAKLQMLRRAGFAENDLYLVVLRDTRRELDHAVLVVRADDRLLVLDNGTNRIMDSDVMPEYRPILTYSGDRAWTHGYRRAAPTITYASLEQSAAPAPVEYAALDLGDLPPLAGEISAPTDLGSMAFVSAGLSLGGLALPF